MNHLGTGGFAHLAQPNISGHQLVLLILKQNHPKMHFLKIGIVLISNQKVTLKSILPITISIELDK